MFTEYGELSTMLYQLTKPAGYSIDGDLEYYYEHLKSTKGKILEAGVGTGRMMIPFLQKGLDVEGVDVSEDMLKQCRANTEAEKVKGTLYQGDLTDLHLPEKYEAIIMPTGSFCLLPRNQVKDILRSFYQHLEVGGKIIIDLELPTGFIPDKVSTGQFSIDNETGILFTSTTQGIDWLQQKTSSIHRYDLLKNGKIQETEISNFVLYWYGIQEFQLLLEHEGYSSIEYKLGYERDTSSSLITFFASKE
ncbi:class I SAM-dependent methyltransferase [Bacillus sp. FSL K6-3431]|uniref:class I SAM-dependent methyltransferase n=1 Tax=Bacillus sp. FSL K6-3431 TaxID=2921500 RepID=UPI0030F66A7E